MSITLTIAEIKDLAEYAGLTLNKRCNAQSEDELATEITITDCPAGGTKDDDGAIRHYAHIAYYTDYPEEGCMPLGPESTE